MTRMVECPACEAESPFAGPANTEFDCPFCRYRFLISKSLLCESPEGSHSELPVQAMPVPRVVAQRRHRTETVSLPGPAPTNESSIDNEWSGLPDTSATSRVSRIANSNKNKAGIWLLGGLLTALLVIGAGFSIANLGASRSSPASGILAPPGRMPRIAVSPTVESPNSKPASKGESNAVANSDQDWDELRLGRREDYYSLWTKIHPHLVRLEVHTPSETRTVAGVIVDSRGYVATSFNAIHDAVSIEVCSAAKALVAGAPLGELNDQVRGLLAKDESRDLAVVEINRRFVSTFANLKFGNPNSALPGDRCVVASPPQTTHRIWIADFPIRQVQTLERLMPPLKDSMSQLKLDAGTSTSWIVGEVPHDRFVPGASVFNFAGELVALLTTVSEQSNAVACPGHWIQELLKNPPRTATPFPINPHVAELISTAEAIKQRLPAAESPAFGAAERLQQLIQSITEYKFLPQTAEQFQTLGDFSESVLQLDELFQSDKLSDDQRLEAQAFLDDTLDRFQTQLQRSLHDHPESAAAINQWAWEFAGNANGFAAFGDVVRNGLQDLDNPPFVIFRLGDDERHIFTSVRHEGPIFIPGSHWFLIGKFLPRLSFRSTDGITIIDARVCEIRYVFSLDADGHE